ncbi:FecR domain-containing protein [Herbaspirillum lusitanum]|uniref:FecR domain-containing protein n=1 Tax=Herbaspirillum lusitanum TaxID=213312 RepID=A0ABW9A3H5_9BURK
MSSDLLHGDAATATAHIGKPGNATRINKHALGQAVDWLMRLQSEQVSEADHQALRQWLAASPEHVAAWARVEALRSMMQPLPQGVLSNTMQRVNRHSRRRALGILSVIVALPATWLAWRERPWEQVMADLHTTVGERRSVQLPDGTTLVLNSHSAVNVLFNDKERRIRLLAGEILITTAPDPATVHRNFLVETPQGLARALGTRFSVRRLDGDSLVRVFEGAVEIQNHAPAQKLVLQARQQSRFGPDGIAAATPADPDLLMWERGMLVAKDMRLADLLAELSRYRRGILRCDPEVARLRVSGAFPLNDIDLSLRLLTETMPIRLHSVSRYWITVAAS